MDHAKELTSLAPYVRFLQNCAALKDWSISLEYDPNCNDAYAYIFCTYGRKRAVMSICPSFWEQDEEGRKHSITHELVHCHLRQISVIYEMLREQMGSLVYSQVSKTIDGEIELAVDGIADGWSKSLPTFSQWVKAGKPESN